MYQCRFSTVRLWKNAWYPIFQSRYYLSVFNACIKGNVFRYIIYIFFKTWWCFSINPPLFSLRRCLLCSFLFFSMIFSIAYCLHYNYIKIQHWRIQQILTRKPPLLKDIDRGCNRNNNQIPKCQFHSCTLYLCALYISYYRSENMMCIFFWTSLFH